jgi:hypothetical protein
LASSIPADALPYALAVKRIVLLYGLCGGLLIAALEALTLNRRQRDFGGSVTKENVNESGRLKPWS